MNNCRHCDEEYENGHGTFCTKSCQGKYARSKRKAGPAHTKYNDPAYKAKQKLARSKYNDNQFGSIVTVAKQCCICDKNFEYSYRDKKEDPNKEWCSRPCNAINTGRKTAEKTGATLKKMAAADPNWGFKNKENHRLALEASLANPANDRRMTSKSERAVRAVLQENQDGWAAHRLVADKAVDCMNKDLKIIFEYDGPTHFRDIFGNMERQQRKDRNVKEWIMANPGWRIYRISDHYFKKRINSDPKKVYDDIQEFLKSDEQILLRYTGQETSW